MNALVVDRDWAVRDALKRHLERSGYTVMTAENAEEAVNLCTAREVALLVTSADLPEMTGFELADRVRRGRRDLDTACIVLLERDPAFAGFLGRRSGKVERLVKPVTAAGLRACLRRLKREVASEFTDV